MLSHEQMFQAAMANPEAALRAIDKMESEASLLGFIKNGWNALEPSQPFVSGWAVEATCEHLEAVTNKEIRRLLINVPPGCTKSMTTSVYWPAWEWGPKNMPSHRFILAAHEQSLAVRDNVRSRTARHCLLIRSSAIKTRTQ